MSALKRSASSSSSSSSSSSCEKKCKKEETEETETILEAIKATQKRKEKLYASELDEIDRTISRHQTEIESLERYKLDLEEKIDEAPENNELEWLNIALRLSKYGMAIVPDDIAIGKCPDRVCEFIPEELVCLPSVVFMHYQVAPRVAHGRDEEPDWDQVDEDAYYLNGYSTINGLDVEDLASSQDKQGCNNDENLGGERGRYRYWRTLVNNDVCLVAVQGTEIRSLEGPYEEAAHSIYQDENALESVLINGNKKGKTVTMKWDTFSFYDDDEEEEKETDSKEELKNKN